MTKNYTIHNRSNAPEAAKEMIQKIEERYGVLPNVLGAMSAAPNVLKAYMDMSAAIAAGTLSAIEQQIVQMTVNRFNGCTYCLSAHMMIADLSNLEPEIMLSLRDNVPLQNKKFEGLRIFTQAMLDKKGRISPEDLNAFMEAGYTKPQSFEVVASIARKMLSNYTVMMVEPSVDEAFKPFQLQK